MSAQDDASVITLSRPTLGEPDVQVKLSPNVTGDQLLKAEQQLGTTGTGFHLRIDGESVDSSLPLPNMSLVTMVPMDWNPNDLLADKVVPCCMSIDDFLKYIRQSDVNEATPVTDISRLFVVRHPSMAQMERLGLLDLQGPVWGDDELLFGLERIASDAGDEQHASVWDPLLISGLVQQDVPATWPKLVNPLGPVCTVVSAVLLGGHWIPLVWRVDAVGAVLHTISVTAEYEHVLEKLSRVFEICRGGAHGVWKPHCLGFVPDGFCGALALAFVKHLVWGWPMVADQHDLELTSQSMRLEFANFLPDPCVRPILAGLGVTITSRLADLLVSHGVAPSESGSRAAAAVKALGEPGITKALDSDNAWRELKWLGNQLRPPFMFIKPSELQAQIDKRHDQPIGNKRHKRQKASKGKGKGLPSPVSVDPTSLRLERGIFQSEQGQPLSQLGLSQVGPTVAGVVVVSVHAVEPHLFRPTGLLCCGLSFSTGDPFPCCSCTGSFGVCLELGTAVA